MADREAAFVWYELLTTDLAAALAFYHKVIGWEVRDTSTPQFAYRVFNVRGSAVAGLMELPPEGRQRGAMPRWVGYVAVQDVDGTVDRLSELGGRVYVPPTDSNIGRIAVIADAQAATLGLVSGLRFGGPQTNVTGGPGHVAWHELLAGERTTAFAFYSALFGWEQADAESAGPDGYQLFAAGGAIQGGIFTKFVATPVPFWLYYFEVPDLDVAIAQVRAGGGRLAQGPVELWEGVSIARCIDPQGAMFALQGRRSETAGRSGESESDAGLAWSSRWGGIASRGQLVGTKPKGKNRS